MQFAALTLHLGHGRDIYLSTILKFFIFFAFVCLWFAIFKVCLPLLYSFDFFAFSALFVKVFIAACCLSSGWRIRRIG